ncbi:MAG TPA: hypothetical protein VJ385_23260 [Fibrobacteria bacterium]|nr:hypothetical protein [Fibrobacteria bacterium]
MPSMAMPSSGLTFKYQGTKKMVLASNGTVGISGGESGTAFSGLTFKLAGANSVALSTTGFLTIPGSFSNNAPPLIGMVINSPSNQFYLTSYGKLATNGTGVIQQYSP